MSIPVLLPLRDGIKEPRHDGMELHGADAGDAFCYKFPDVHVFSSSDSSVNHPRLIGLPSSR